MEFGIFGVIILWIIFNVVARLIGSKRNKDKTNSSNKIQAVEEQKRRREVYEAAKKQTTKPKPGQTVMDTIAEVFEELDLDLPKSSKEYYPAESKPADEPRTLVRTYETNKPIINKKVAAAPRDVVFNVAAANTVAPSYVDMPATTAYATDATPWVPDTIDELHPNRHTFSNQELRQGIIMAEILGPCRAKAKRQY